MFKKDIYHTKDLIKNSFDNLKKFTFEGMITKAKVIDIYDGDTITIVFYFHDIPIKDTFRMNGYDSPEMKPIKDIQNRNLHITAAKYVKEFLKKKLLNQIVWVKFSHKEKYGRLIGDLYMINPNNKNQFIGNEECINRLMISSGFGKQYGGGHKLEFTDIELNNIITKFN